MLIARLYFYSNEKAMVAAKMVCCNQQLSRMMEILMSWWSVSLSELALEFHYFGFPLLHSCM